jgi:hypothetical protein
MTQNVVDIERGSILIIDLSTLSVWRSMCERGFIGQSDCYGVGHVMDKGIAESDGEAYTVIVLRSLRHPCFVSTLETRVNRLRYGELFPHYYGLTFDQGKRIGSLIAAPCFMSFDKAIQLYGMLTKPGSVDPLTEALKHSQECAISAMPSRLTFATKEA